MRNLFSYKYYWPLLFLFAAFLPISTHASDKVISLNDNVGYELDNVNAFINNNPTINSPRNAKPFTIVIDAGHGGKDHGCSGSHSKEKHIVLEIAKKVGDYISYYHPEVKVIYTRTQDVFIPLFKRAEMANNSEADLFISIHCNAVRSGSPSGSETYVMGLHTAQENLEVAKRENEAILLENNYQKNYDGYDPNSAEGHIILSMFQNAHLEQSIEFANNVESSLAKRTPLSSRGVKQAGFVVLRRATMPSVLIETGFLSNKDNQEYLKSKQGQDDVSLAIVRAFTQYKRSLDEKNMHNDLASEKIETKIVNQSSSKTSNPKVKATVDTKVVPVYKVQIAASMKKPITKNGDLFKGVEDVEIREEDNMYKYLTGSYDSLEQAVEAKKLLHDQGFKGAFVVAYQNNSRIKTR